MDEIVDLVNYLKNILQNSSTRILVVIFFFLIALTGFFIVYGYYSQLHVYEVGELNRLSGIARTLALQIDGDSHARLYSDKKEQDAIKLNTEDSNYFALHNVLARAQRENSIGTDIYTMVYEDDLDVFSFVGTSGEKPYYRHQWRKFKPKHVALYHTGGTIKPYKDEHGTWLSAFSPIKNSRGEVVAVVQVDAVFDDFIYKARSAIARNALISLLVFLLIAVFMLRSIRTILLKEEKLTNEIIKSKQVIEEKNNELTDSIHYAKKIQQAILPSIDSIVSALPNSFVLFLPRDIVSGDFYWFHEEKDRIFIAAVDCTGHGVPGAFMSMIGNTLLNDIVHQLKDPTPALILDHLDQRVQQALNREDSNVESKDGMDMALCSIDKNYQDIQYSGAFRPLFQIRGEEQMEVSGNRFPIGGGNSYEKTGFTNHKVEVKSGDLLYMYSDGYADQFGGAKGKKLMTKKFKRWLIEYKDKPMNEQHDIFQRKLLEWRGVYEQVDDVLLIGIRVP